MSTTTISNARLVGSWRCYFPKEVQERLGHASITTTMDRYAHVNRFEADDRARLALAALRPAASATGNVIALHR